MAFINPSIAYPQPDIKEILLDRYIGEQWTALPTPSFFVQRSIVHSNVAKMLRRVEIMNTKFRAHVKTHKTIEGVRKQLGYDLPGYNGPKHEAIVISTLKEAWSIADYQEKTGNRFVRDVIYGLPNVTDESLEQVVDLQNHFDKFTLLIDSLDHISIIKKFISKKKVERIFNVIVKLDNGTHRAGILNTDYLIEVINTIVSSPFVQLYGFYVHSGHSYHSSSIEESEERLLEELETVNKGLNLLHSVIPEYDLSKLIVSVGATPTLHSLEHHIFMKANNRIAELAKTMKANLELHAGNYIFCDLQQASTGCITQENVAIGLIGTVISQYPKRGNEVGELLTNTGVISLSREVAAKYPGFGLIKSDYGVWRVDRLSQEHGILAPIDETTASLIPIGSKVKILPNHACITANSFNAYYVLGDDGAVEDVWIPWRGW